MPTPENPHQLVRLQRQLEAAQKVSEALFQRLTLQELVEEALSVALEVADAEGGSVLLANPDSQEFTFHYSVGHGVMPGTSFPLRAGIAGEVFRSGKPELIRDAKCDSRHFRGIDALHGFITRDLIAVPLKHTRTQRYEGAKLYYR